MAAVELTGITWQLAHEALSRLARERAAADAEEGRWLLAAQRAAVHVHLGFGAFSEYVERMFGYKPRSTHEKLRVAAALERLPAFAQALSSGELNWSAVRELTRVAVRENEREWLDFAHGKTLRQLEQVLAGKRPGDAPSAPADPAAQRHVLRFEVAAETYALFSDALNELRRRAGVTLDDDSALLELARCVLGGPTDAGRASYQVVLAVCPNCNNGQQHSAAGLVPVDADVLRMAHCDAQHLAPLTSPSPLPANDLAPHESLATKNQSAHESPATKSQSAHQSPAIKRQSAHVGAGNREKSGRLRAKQSIPPALRRAVLLRDQHRCQVPGCQNTRWVDVHHLDLRTEGGAHTLENLVCVCSSHHRAAHRGKLLIDRMEGGALRVRHADGSEYGGRVQPRALELRTKVFSALRNLGFREGMVRAALEQLERAPGPEQASFDGLLRAALARLCPAGVRR